MTESDRISLSASLWVSQWTLAAVFHVLGLFKAFVPAAVLQQGLHLVTLAPAAVLRPVGVVELVGSLGLVLPAATGVLPRLTPLAAACLSGVALLGLAQPQTAGGFALVVPNLLLALACAGIAWGRIALAPIVPLGLREAARADLAQADAYLARGRGARQVTQADRKRVSAA